MLNRKVTFVTVVTSLAIFLSGAAQALPLYILHDLGTLGGTFSSGYGVNNNGQVTGASSLRDDTTRHAFVGNATSGLTDLGTLGGTHSVVVPLMTMVWSLGLLRPIPPALRQEVIIAPLLAILPMA